MKKLSWTILISLTALLAAGASVWAQEEVIRLYPGKAPGSEDWNWEEKHIPDPQGSAGIVYNVVDPSITVFRPKEGAATGAAVVICPGGGMHMLAMGHEGYDVARWLAERGVAGFVLKYRLVRCETDNPMREMFSKGPSINEVVAPVVKLATEDAKNAIRYVREHAAEFGVDPNRIGIMGFSAGGAVTASVAHTYDATSRPAFAAPIYAAYIWALKEPVKPDAPPVFVVAATDDQLRLGPQSVEIYQTWYDAGKPAELHMFVKGGHGFGVRRQNLPTDRWIELFYDWLGVMGFLGKTGN
ncbi:MAG: alpha/beta hydrolase [Acidobacteriota bacterium]